MPLSLSPLIIIGPLGMMAVAVASIIYWRRRKAMPLHIFLLGGALWALAILGKLVMDLTISPPFYQWLGFTLSPIIGVFLMGLYIGLRTGILENGFTYLGVARSKRLRKANFDEAIALGIGFGGFEALLLGGSNFVNLLVLILYPQLIPPEYLDLAEKQMSLGLPILLVPALERSFTILVHIYTSVLVIYSFRARRTLPFIYAFLFKSALDGIIPWFNQYLDLSTPLGIYLSEAVVVAFGLAGYLGVRRLRGDFQKLQC